MSPEALFLGTTNIQEVGTPTGGEAGRAVLELWEKPSAVKEAWAPQHPAETCLHPCPSRGAMSQGRQDRPHPWTDHTHGFADKET